MKTMITIDVILLKLPYILIFYPLLISVFVFFVSDKKFLKNLTYFSLFLLLSIASIILVNSYSTNNNIFINVDNTNSILGANFKINTINIFYLISILFISIFGFMNYNHEYMLSHNVNIRYRRSFYAIYFLNIFSIIGILTTYDLFHLFLFVELFSFSSFNLMNSSIGKQINIAVYKYFSNNIFGSMVFACAVFYTAMFFNSSNILLIRQQISTLDFRHNSAILLLYFLIIISVVLKFLMFNVVSQTEKKRTLTILSIYNIFISTLIGLFLCYFFTNFVFLLNGSLLTVKIIKMILLLLVMSVAGFVFYSSISNVKTIFDIFINIFLLNILKIIITILFTDTDSYFQLHLLALNNIVVTAVPIYFISAYISELYDDNSVEILNQHFLIKILLIFLLCYNSYSPYTLNYFLINELYKTQFLNKNVLFIILEIMNNCSIIIMSLKIFLTKQQQDFNVKHDFLEVKANAFRYSLVFMFLIIIIISVFATRNYSVLFKNVK